MPYKTAFLCMMLLLVSYVIQAQVQEIGGDQTSFSFESPKSYKIGGVVISGTNDLDKQVLINLSGLTVGDEITVPGERTTKAIENLWKQGLFSNIKIYATKIEGSTIFLDVLVEEKPRLTKFSFKGVKKSDADDLREKIKLIKGKVVTDNLLVNTKQIITDFYKDKGYLDAIATIKTIPDSIQRNSVFMNILVNKGSKVKIHEIYIDGNTAFTDGKIRRTLKETKRKRWYNIFNQSKFLEENYQGDKDKLIAKYNAKGYRDAKIKNDTVFRYEKNLIDIVMNIDEGNKYYFRNITWLGNTKYTSAHLSDILGIKKGDVFNQDLLNSRINMSQDGRDVSSLYMDDGYLFFQIQPTEVQVDGDSIDYEIRMSEGKQARINRIIINGNTKTNDRVILREIRTKPGQLFSRADIIRTQRELAQLRYFDEQKMGVNPIPNPADGTVDIEYTVEEKPSDQVQLSGGWGAGRIVGTLGVSFNNFSTKNFFKKGAWAPVPAGDGQSLSIQAQSNGLYYQNYSISFMEPWLGGKKPNSFSTSIYHSIQNPSGVTYKQNPTTYGAIKITGASIGLGKRLKVPDDYFQLYQDITYQHYKLINYNYNFAFSDGNSNNLNYQLNLSRSSVDAPIYPTSGSVFKLSLQLTPPYSSFRKDSLGTIYSEADYAAMPTSKKYNWIEYHKWKFTSQWYTKLVGKLVLNTKVGYGILAHYNQGIGTSPFERFYLGGSGLTGYNVMGGEYIALRGYSDNSLSSNGKGGSVISKYTMELRYPISLNPQATIFALTFAEAGNTWSSLKEFTPFNVKRSVGVGVRAFLPMFGLLGLDYGWNLDPGPANALNTNFKGVFKGLNGLMGKGQFHFTIGANIGDL